MNEQSKTIPLPLAIMILATLFLAGAGGILIYLKPWQKPKVARVTAPSANTPRVAGGPSADPTRTAQAIMAAREADLEDGCHRLDEQTLLFKTGDAYFKVRTQEGEDSYSFGSYSLSDLAWEHGYLSQGVRRILTQADFAKELGVTKAQVDKLEDLPAPPATKWEQKERQKVLDVYGQWKAAAGGERERKVSDVLAQLKAVAGRKKSADDAAMAARVKSIRAILTAEQLQQINPIPRWEVK